MESANDNSGCASAMRSNSATMLESSVWLLFRNLRRAGMLKKRFLIRKLAPTGQTMGSCNKTFEPSICRHTPNSLSGVRVRSSTWETAAIEASASPRNPIVVSEKRSSAFVIFEVACRSKDRRASVSVIPLPLSMTCTHDLPASVTMT